MATFKFATKDMIPGEWHLTPEQERQWLAHAAAGLTNETADTLQRMVAIELPDTFTAWAYQEAYVEAAKERDDLVAPVITSQEQWRDRVDELANVVRCLWEGEPPAVVFCALAVPKK